MGFSRKIYFGDKWKPLKRCLLLLNAIKNNALAVGQLKSVINIYVIKIHYNDVG